jgi:CBS-domain-containing membrane protein
MRVADLMQTDVQSIAPDAPIVDLVNTLADTRVSGLPVVDESAHVIGVVSAADVLREAAALSDPKARSRTLARETVRDIMTPNAQLIAPDADVREAAKRMRDADVRRLFVEDQGRLIGVISQTDIANAVGAGRL